MFPETTDPVQALRCERCGKYSRIDSFRDLIQSESNRVCPARSTLRQKYCSVQCKRGLLPLEVCQFIWRGFVISLEVGMISISLFAKNLHPIDEALQFRV